MSTPTSVTLPARDLHNAVKNILHFAPKTLPKNAVHLPLDGAHFTVRRGVFVIEATDTAKMLQIHVSFDRTTTINAQANGAADDATLGIVSTEDLKALELMLRDSAKVKDEPYPVVELICGDQDLTVRNVAQDTSATYALVTDQRYPNIDTLLTAFDFQQPPSTVLNVYDPAHFKALTAVSDTRASRRKQSLSLCHDPKRKAVAIHWIAEGRIWAQGLLMPLIDAQVNTGVDLTKTVQF